MDFRPIQPDQVKYEMRVVKGEDPFVKHRKRPGGFGRFLSSIGRIFGAIAAPLSLIFPPAMIGALGAYGLSSIGDKIQYKAHMRSAQQAGQHQNVSFPGMDWGALGMGGGPQASISPVQAEALNVLYARNDLMMESAHAMEG